MEKYALFFCANSIRVTLFQFITFVQIEEWDFFPAKAGDVMFYLAEAFDNDKEGKTAPEKLKWIIIGTDMNLVHGKENVYLLTDQ